MLLGTGLRCRCALSLPRPQPSRAAHSATTADPYAKLEAAWLRYAGPDAISRLHGLVTPRSVLTVGGSQLIGKSTLAGRLAAALSGEMQSAGRLFRNEAARRGISVPELSRSAMNNPQIDGTYTHTHQPVSHTVRSTHSTRPSNVVLLAPVAIEYSLACLIAGGLSSSTGPLVLEGRQPAVMARYVRDRLGKVSSSTIHYPRCTRITVILAKLTSVACCDCEQSECKSVYVTCSVREQALRFIEREAGKRYAVEAGASIPQRHFASLSEVEPYVKQLVSGMRYTVLQ